MTSGIESTGCGFDSGALGCGVPDLCATRFTDFKPTERSGLCLRNLVGDDEFSARTIGGTPAGLFWSLLFGTEAVVVSGRTGCGVDDAKSKSVGSSNGFDALRGMQSSDSSSRGKRLYKSLVIKKKFIA